MALNFPDFGGDGGFDWKRFGQIDGSSNWGRYLPYIETWNATKNDGTKAWSASGGVARKTYHGNDDFSDLSQSQLKSMLRKGLYLINVVIDIAPENVTQSISSAGFKKYGPSFSLNIPHSELMLYGDTPASMTPITGGENGYQPRFTDFVTKSYFTANESFKHPGFRMKSQQLAFIDPQYIGSDPTLYVDYTFAGGTPNISYNINCDISNIAFCLLYDMEDGTPSALPYQFWKED